jgi:uncharacterized OB-fold protein
MSSRQAPIEDGYFTLADGEPPRLVGSFSPAAGLSFFPRRRVCPVTFQPVEDRLLATTGTLYTWTFVQQDRYGADAASAGAYGVGQVDLDDGPRVQARLLGRMGDWTIGMRMTLDVYVVSDADGLWTDADGRELVNFCFRPVVGTA